ncbi:hypothetical protein CKA32_006658 [Geitlerinema sp. FC II]|nr:hypothetical protein CKA32_006658 [Geitlerinema sp. FC II]
MDRRDRSIGIPKILVFPKPPPHNFIVDFRRFPISRPGIRDWSAAAAGRYLLTLLLGALTPLHNLGFYLLPVPGNNAVLDFIG